MKKPNYTALLYELGGIVEGHPTAEHNWLQRVRELVHREKQLKDIKNSQVMATLVKGPEGYCLILGGYRVGGPKPWAGSSSEVAKIRVRGKDLLKGFGICADEPYPRDVK